jgi:cell division protein ZapE
MSRGRAGDGPLRRYEQALARGQLQRDTGQEKAVQAFERIRRELAAKPAPRRKMPFGRRRDGWPPVPGLYLWGGVGRGKTMLMDSFHASLPISAARRTHFHRFMLEVHARRRGYLDEQDPVALIGEELASELRVLCFDEFFVSDIADAMILARLTEVLFRQGVTLVATSNVAPDDLYRDGLQRERFLPAIERIKQNCTVMELDSPNDFRLRTLTGTPLYLHPCDEAAMQSLAKEFTALAPDGAAAEPVTLQINGRPLQALGAIDDVAWFAFAELCQGARAASDYIALAREYQTVLLSGVPQLDRSLEDSARRFLHLVDEFYDRNVKLVIAAHAPLETLYSGDKLRFEFQRTVSRLTEMQSNDYLARAHRPV